MGTDYKSIRCLLNVLSHVGALELLSKLNKVENATFTELLPLFSTPKMLTDRLKEMRGAGLIERNIIADPQSKRYNITEMGKKLLKNIEQVGKGYGLRYVDDDEFIEKMKNILINKPGKILLESVVDEGIIWNLQQVNRLEKQGKVVKKTKKRKG